MNGSSEFEHLSDRDILILTAERVKGLNKRMAILESWRFWISMGFVAIAAATARTEWLTLIR